MKNPYLARINFRHIVDYGGQPPVQPRCEPPLRCRGYCVRCEESGVLDAAGGHLSLMSHGCDSADFETVLGPMPVRDGFTEPVMFLLEDPGGDYGNGETVSFRDQKKMPPVHHYYWTPTCSGWPSSPAEFDGNYYGPYFAYLMRRHGLRNVYITNVAKCKHSGSKAAKNAVARHCMQEHLMRELQAFAPRVVFCFGRRAEAHLQRLKRVEQLKAASEYLYHPCFVKSRSQTIGKSREDLMRENDGRISNALARAT